MEIQTDRKMIAKASQTVIFDTVVKEYYETDDASKIEVVCGGTTTFGLEAYKRPSRLIEKSRLAETLLSTFDLDGHTEVRLYKPTGQKYGVFARDIYKRVPVIALTSKGERKGFRKEKIGKKYFLFSGEEELFHTDDKKEITASIEKIIEEVLGKP
jgi:hypothetical protein